MSSEEKKKSSIHWFWNSLPMYLIMFLVGALVGGFFYWSLIFGILQPQPTPAGDECEVCADDYMACWSDDFCFGSCHAFSLKHGKDLCDKEQPPQPQQDLLETSNSNGEIICYRAGKKIKCPFEHLEEPQPSPTCLEWKQMERGRVIIDSEDNLMFDRYCLCWSNDPTCRGDYG